jgi:response regulator RpfG family c-di-GMP phosphodiesterase
VSVAAPARVATRWVYDFLEGSRDMRHLLGGKGANVAENERLPASPKRGAGTVVLVEDEELVRSLATRTLRRQWYRVLEATDGHQALDICAGQHIDSL